MAQVGIIMGSKSDYDTMRAAAETLAEFDVPYEIEVVSAHRTPDKMFEYAKSAKERGLLVIIAGAGGAAHLPGMVASLTPLPVIGVPVETKALKGIDSLLSIVQMPAGIPVATVAIGNARNAALLAVRILAIEDERLEEALELFEERQREAVAEMNRSLRSPGKEDGGPS
jgi:5-(carboxyamino)imidazole ribonucleotide mutase